MNLGFISDLHLSETNNSLTNAFIDFLKSHSSNLDQLYILGDLYEVWIGDDDSSSLITSTKDALRKASKSGLEIFFIHGNRDFLLDSSFAESAGITILPDPFFFDYFGKKISISHGDIFCIDDAEYQAFKKQVRSPEWKAEFLNKSLVERKSIASSMRDASKRNSSQKDSMIMDVNTNEVASFFDKYDIDLLIHGHTHKPNIHELSGKNSKIKRIVLGDWGKTGWCFYLDPTSQNLEEFKI